MEKINVHWANLDVPGVYTGTFTEGQEDTVLQDLLAKAYEILDSNPWPDGMCEAVFDTEGRTYLLHIEVKDGAFIFESTHLIDVWDLDILNKPNIGPVITKPPVARSTMVSQALVASSGPDDWDDL